MSCSDRKDIEETIVPISQDDNAQIGNNEEQVEVLDKFPEGDVGNPYNWTKGRKMFIILTTSATLFNSTLASSLSSNAMPGITAEFGVDTTRTNPELVLPISLFLVGYVFGPLLFGPLSEMIGRRVTMLLAFAGYTAFTLGCALAPNWQSFLTFRLFCGIFACAPVNIGAGIVADVYNDPAIRGRAMAYFLGFSLSAPLIAPSLSGYISEAATWRWAFWAAVIVAGVTWVPLVFLPETYTPVLLARRAKEMRKQALEAGRGNTRTLSPIETEHKSWQIKIGMVLARPAKIFCTELIVSTSSIYMAVVYAIYFMFFQAYPLIFRDIYGMGPGVMGLMYLPVGAGTLLGVLGSQLWDHALARAKQRGKSWAHKEKHRRLPLACVGGPLLVIGLFWLGWTAREDISWVVPFMAGVPFGIGNFVIAISLTNYLSDAYGIYSASVMAAASCTRNILGAALPLATGEMYRSLGIGWATSLVGFLSLGMCGLPFVLIYYGEMIQERSKFSRSLLKATR
ncbi:major facilitator superfamily domain-containing protein [Stachybotrys elegans]|uniref:Major facilitator superfamily domain-containing protein n=1 Tax=Stachybotrys elegans TaxID=80388 RepID=A0A8K0SKN1_9HYPO|nr:major facilitator superfamily domain-containing protein [Stachybotrys elegans]